LAVVENPQDTILWDVGQRHVQAVLTDYGTAVAFSPDGALLIAQSGLPLSVRAIRP
jgi:hypothetical protein